MHAFHVRAPLGIGPLNRPSPSSSSQPKRIQHCSHLPSHAAISACLSLPRAGRPKGVCFTSLGPHGRVGVPVSMGHPPCMHPRTRKRGGKRWDTVSELNSRRPGPQLAALTSFPNDVFLSFKFPCLATCRCSCKMQPGPFRLHPSRLPGAGTRTRGTDVALQTLIARTQALCGCCQGMGDCVHQMATTSSPPREWQQRCAISKLADSQRRHFLNGGRMTPRKCTDECRHESSGAPTVRHSQRGNDHVAKIQMATSRTTCCHKK